MTPPWSGRHDRASLQARAIRGAAWTGIHTAISLPLAFGVNLLLARVLGVIDYGRLTYLTAVIEVAGSIAALGVGTAVLQFGAKAHSAGRRDDVRSLLRAGSGWRLLVSAPLVTITILFLVRLDPAVLVLALVFGVWLPSALGGLGIALNIEQKTAQGAQAGLIGSLIMQAAVVVSLLWSASAESVWAARMIASTLTVLILLPFIHPAYRKAVLLPRNPFRLPKAFWRFAIPTGVAATLGGLVTSRSEVLLLEWMSTPEAVGLFSLAFGLASHVFAPAQVFVGPLVPALSGLAEVEPPAVRRAFLRVLRCSSVVAGLFVAGALPAFAALVPLLYGRDFSAAADMVVALGIVASLGLISGPMSAFLYARLGGGRILKIEVVSLLVNVVAAVALIPPFGAWGAVASGAIAIMVRTALLSVGEARHLAVGGREALRSTATLIVSAGIAVIAWLSANSLGGPAVVTSLLLGLVGTLLLVTVVRALRIGIDSSDRDAIARTAPPQIRRAVDKGLGLVTIHERAT